MKYIVEKKRYLSSPIMLDFVRLFTKRTFKLRSIIRFLQHPNAFSMFLQNPSFFIMQKQLFIQTTLFVVTLMFSYLFCLHTKIMINKYYDAKPIQTNPNQTNPTTQPTPKQHKTTPKPHKTTQ